MFVIHIYIYIRAGYIHIYHALMAKKSKEQYCNSKQHTLTTISTCSFNSEFEIFGTLILTFYKTNFSNSL